MKEELVIPIFDNTTLSDIFKDIYTSQQDKKLQLQELIQEILPMVKSPGDAAILVPLIQKYLDTGVKNDDILVKMTSIVQKTIQTNMVAEKSDSDLTFEELQQLQSASSDIDNDVKMFKLGS